jgi:hypothetical protein
MAIVALLDFGFMGGSMGTAVGEGLVMAADLAVARKAPLIVFSASGGARMQEGALSLMQMAKISAGLARLDEARLGEALKTSLADQSEPLRKAATQLQAQTKPTVAYGQLKATLESGSIGEKQTALAALGTIPGSAADEILSQWLDKLANGQVVKDLQLDLLEAAEKRSNLKERVERYQAAQPKDDPPGDRQPAVSLPQNADESPLVAPPQSLDHRCHLLPPTA